MKYRKQIFDRLTRGAFISSDSTEGEMRRIYKDLEDNYEAYREYFEPIGFVLEQGQGYYYFSRQEPRASLSEKLERYGHWIDVVDFLKAWEPALGPGFEFSKAQLIVKIETDIELKEKINTIYDRKEKLEETVQRLIDELLRRGFVEPLNEDLGRYVVVASYLYLEEMINLITITSTDEIPE